MEHSVKTCGTCQHWGKHYSSTDLDGERVGGCAAIDEYYEVGAGPALAVAAECCSLASAFFVTRSAFGCVLHEPKVAGDRE